MIPWLSRPSGPTPDGYVSKIGDSRETRCPSPEELPLWFFLDALNAEVTTIRSEQRVQWSATPRLWRRVLRRDRSPLLTDWPASGDADKEDAERSTPAREEKINDSLADQGVPRQRP